MKTAKLCLFALLVVAGPALAAEAPIVQKDQTFSSAAISIHVGDMVKFSNSDTVTHNITIKGGSDDDADDLGLQKPGQMVTHKFDAKGVYRVVCSIHPRMKMQVTVQ